MTVDMALGCSTNSMLHLPAIAHEAGVELNLEIANETSKYYTKPLSLSTSRFYIMEDLDDAGGVFAVMNELDSLGI